MSGKPFLDTNLLIYALSDPDPRADVARQILEKGGVLSVQVLNEFVSTARQKWKMSWQDIQEATTNFQVLCPDPVPLSLPIHEAALKIAQRYGYRFYDSLIIAAALAVRCNIIYSEDMQNGQRIDGLTIRNPFAENPDDRD